MKSSKNKNRGVEILITKDSPAQAGQLEQPVGQRTAALTAEIAERKRTEQEQARLLAIIEATPDFVGTADLDGHPIFINRAGLHMLGYEARQDAPPTIYETHPEWAAKLVREEGIPHAIEHGAWSGETAFLRRDGREIPVSQVIIAHKGKSGSVEYLSTIARDISERKQAEAALRASESRFRLMFERTADALLLLDAKAGQFIDCNQAAADMLRCTDKKELLLLHPAKLSPPYQPDGRPSGEKADEMIATALRNGSHRFEWIHCSAHRADFPVEVLLTPLLIEEQQLIIATWRDISERKAQEAKVARLNRVYAVLSGINTTIVRVRDRQYLFAEACRIAVGHGRFRMAWIGLLDPKGEDVTPAARAGFDEGYLDKIRLTARDDDPDACVLVARALREKTPVVCNDIGADPSMARWREAALQRGYHSLVVLPLVVDDKVVGVFVLYAPETGFFDADEMKLLIEMAGDISFAMDHLQKEERLSYLAYYDVLTGLPNHELFFDRLNQLLLTAGKDNAMVAVLVLDLERFRAINETLGRQGGDVLLKQVAERLSGAGLDGHHLARIGADCFAVALTNLRKEADAAYILERRIIASLCRPFVVEGVELRISAKAGIALFPADGADAETLFRNAEAALKKAKLSGDKYLFYTPEINARVTEKLTLENKLRLALEQQQFVLHYQPVIELKNRRISGLEALIRWNDPDTGLVPPLMFIPLLEETGMILDVGRWALEQAMRDFRRWQADGLQPPRIAVNVSAIQLRHKDFVGMVERVLHSAGGAADCLELEITESLIMQDIEANIEKLRAVRNMGVAIAIDDFGTGYSSLSYIAKLPLNTLKIDVAFVVNMVRQPDDLSIVTAIISLAHSLNLRVVAEGVETEEQANLLRLLKCEEVQGFLFSPAVPAEQIEIFLREKQSLSGQTGAG